MEKLQAEIKELEQWLIEHPDHKDALHVQHNLQLKKQELINQESTRTLAIERDTFDITNYEFFKKE